MNGGGMGLAAALFAAVAGVIVAAWAWLGMPVEMPQAPVGPGEKLQCISYAPFRGDQNPFGPGPSHRCPPDRRGLGPAQAGDGLHPHLFDRPWP